MKKATYAFFFAATLIFVYSFSSAKLKKTRIPDAPPPVCSINLTQDLNTMEIYNTALGNINNYIGDNTLNKNSYSFIFNVDNNFKTFIGNAGIQYVHFIFAQDGNRQLMLYISALTSSSNHVYIHDKPGGIDQYYVFKNTMSQGPAIPRTAPVVGGTTAPMSGVYAQNSLEINSDGIGWINDYISYTNSVGPSKNITAYSYAILSSVLNNYITSQPSITRLAIYIANNSSKLHIVIIGQDATGKEVYINDGAGGPFYVLEYCNPCPECLGVPGRQPLQFEAPCNNGALPQIYYIDYKAFLNNFK